MSDQPETPPPKKIGSLRDRIAAFEKAGAGSAVPAPAPAPRPKPAGFASWKPRPPSPTSPATVETSESSSSIKSAGMSTADAKESIVKGGSLKERMAALQGKGAFGAPPPVAPKPAEKPKWKPPPVVAAPSDDEEEENPRAAKPDLSDIIKSPPTQPTTSSDNSEEKASESGEGQEKAAESTEGEEENAEVDPEEEERQRRAAIAARMARLGGTRVGMAPPVFGKRPPPPPKKRSSVSEDVAQPEGSKEGATSPKLQAAEPDARESIDSVDLVSSPPSESITSASPPSQATEATPRRLSEAASLASIESSESQAQSSRSPPTSMPVPAAPRRAAPPRKKPAKKPTMPPPPVPEVEGESEQKGEEPKAVAAGAEPSTEEEVPAKQAEVNPPVEALVTPLPPTLVAGGDSPSASKEIVEGVGDAKATSTQEEPVSERPASPDTPVAVKTGSLKELVDEPAVEEEEESEVDEETRRRQVAERIAKMGGLNPLVAPPARKQSSADSDVVRSPPSEPKATEQPLKQEAEQTPAVSSTESNKRASQASERSVSPITQEGSYDKPSSPKKEEADRRTDALLEPVEKRESMTSAVDDKDDDSEYSDEEPTAPVTGSARAEDASSKVDVESQEAEQPPAPSARPQSYRSPEPPARTLPTPPPAAEDIAETDSEDDNDEMTRSQILVPPTKDTQEPASPQAARPTSNSEASNFQGPVSLESTSELSLSDSEEGLDEEPASPQSPEAAPPPPPPRAAAHPPPVGRALPPPPTAAPPEVPVIPVASQGTLRVPTAAEVLDEDEGDPIDPSFHSPSRRTSMILSSSNPVTPPVVATPANENALEAQAAEPAEDEEAARRRTIAERMAKLGGIKFGAAPPVHAFRKQAAPAPQEQEEQDADEGSKLDASVEQPAEDDEEAEEQARKERIAAKLANMGGMRIGMMPTAYPPRKSHVLTEPTSPPPPPPPARAPPSPQAQQQDSESDFSGSGTSDDIVKVEAEESDLEEVCREEVEEETPPPIPTRTARPARRESVEAPSSPPRNPSSPPRRPPVPAGLPARRGSAATVSSQRRVSGDVATSPPPPHSRPPIPKQQSEYVMVEEPQGFAEETAPPPPPQRPPPRRTSTGPPARLPPVEPSDSLSSQWELPSIPTSSLELGGDDLSMSWTEAEAPQADDVITPSASSQLQQQQSPPLSQRTPQPPAAQPSRSANDIPLSADDLIALWGRVGVQVCEAATNLYERSKRGLIGDGTYPGFVRAVIHEVPNALLTDDLGYLIYKQSGSAVQKRASDIMPGDIVELREAKFKGHKGIHAYSQSVGAGGEAVVGVVSEFEPKKSKVRVFQANQHVGQQTVEGVSYRLDDLKSGTIMVYRVIEA